MELIYSPKPIRRKAKMFHNRHEIEKLLLLYMLLILS